MEPNLPRTLLAVPVYNHGATLRPVVEGALRTGFPVLVVDDGSTDGALSTVLDLPVLTRRLPVNRGKGAAILEAARVARKEGYEALLTIDADGQHDPAEARLLVEAAASDWPAVVVGARRMEEGGAPRSSLFGRDFSNFWVRLECGRALPDTQSGYRLYPVEALLSLPYRSRRYAFEVEALVRPAWAGYPLLSVPVSVRYPPAGERVSHFRKGADNGRLSVLHALLVTRSLVPWPHRRLRRKERDGGGRAGLLHPVRMLRTLSREHAGSGELAAAVFVGVFLGALPIVPFGLATIAYVCHRLHLNKLAGAAASNLSAIPVVPFACMETGHLFRHGRFLTVLDRHTLLSELHLRVWEWLLGALVVGPLLGLAAAALFYAGIRAVRSRRAAEAEA
jgi:uncharacterized protein (DUF2062 family)/nucleotide-binding universal stress UspA family protein